MEKFLKANPGLKSRFTRYIDFPDYEVPDLWKIFQDLCDKNELHFSAEARVQALNKIN